MVLFLRFNICATAQAGAMIPNMYSFFLDDSTTAEQWDLALQGTHVQPSRTRRCVDTQPLFHCLCLYRLEGDHAPGTANSGPVRSTCITYYYVVLSTCLPTSGGLPEAEMVRARARADRAQILMRMRWDSHCHSAPCAAVSVAFTALYQGYLSQAGREVFVLSSISLLIECTSRNRASLPRVPEPAVLSHVSEKVVFWFLSRSGLIASQPFHILPQYALHSFTASRVIGAFCSTPSSSFEQIKIF
ncbi:hypothetical protein IF1G_10990 [Cordyceps javanica]|uniref:Uncharacterized protein n=1 Tax=Cordyceps javanica TaxID=43265 RepID=A0A545ULL8_9HYPO|nr:hypothetical protein IF1G_10990 [Cordyceps javanica]